jgi:hypothetical protein
LRILRKKKKLEKKWGKKKSLGFLGERGKKGEKGDVWKEKKIIIIIMNE